MAEEQVQTEEAQVEETTAAEEKPVEDQQQTKAAAEENKPEDQSKAEEAKAEEGNKDTSLLSDDEDGGSDVPEEYSFDAPDGIEISEDVKSRIDEFGTTAKEMGLSQEQFQKLVEYDLNRGEQAEEVLAQAYETRVNEWADNVRNDKEIGGEKFDETIQLAKSAVEQFASDGLKEMINKPAPDNPNGLGLGNHPEFVRLMARVGRALGESELVKGEGPGASDAQNERAALQRLYPTMNQT